MMALLDVSCGRSLAQADLRLGSAFSDLPHRIHSDETGFEINDPFS